MKRTPFSDFPRWAGLAVVVAAALLYVATLDNGLRPGELAGGDLITHQYAQVQARPSNAPGYPLYTMGGWLWFHGLRSLLPSANATAILSAYSVLWALLAVWLLYRLILELTGDWPAAAALSAFYAVSYFFWYYAVSTEQYASAVAQTLAIALLALRWQGQQAAGAGGERTLLALALLTGLSLAHMVTVAVIAPPLLIFLLRVQPKLLRRARLWLPALALACLPLLSYAFIYTRGAQHPEWRGVGDWNSTWDWFLSFISTSQGRGELTWSLHPLWTAEFPRLIWGELTVPVWVLGVIGLARLPRPRAGLFLSALLLYALLGFVDRLGNWYQVVMPAYPLIIAGCAVILHRVRQQPSKLGRVGYVALLAALLVLTAARFEHNWPRADQRNRPEDVALLPGAALLADAPAPDAAVVGVITETLSLQYVTEIAGQRPDVIAVDSAAAREFLTSGARPVYVTHAAAGSMAGELGGGLRLSSAGRSLIRVRTAPATTLPADARPLHLPAGDGLSLAGIARPATPVDDATWAVRLYWTAAAAIGYDWSISVRPTVNGQPIPDGQGGIVLRDSLTPVQGAYPTSRWQSGEMVADDYFIPLPPGVMPTGVQVVIYRTLPGGEFDNLAVLDAPAP